MCGGVGHVEVPEATLATDAATECVLCVGGAEGGKARGMEDVQKIDGRRASGVVRGSPPAATGEASKGTPRLAASYPQPRFEAWAAAASEPAVFQRGSRLFVAHGFGSWHTACSQLLVPLHQPHSKLLEEIIKLSN